MKYKNFDLDKVRNNILKMDENGNIMGNKPFLSTKDNNRFKDILEKEEKNEEDDEINTSSNNPINDDDKENNSMFENCTNKSFDSSFLGSSIAEDFYQTFTGTIEKN